MLTIRRSLRSGLGRLQTGIAAVEFALILPVLLVILFGIINFGIYMYDKAVITNASREGARAGIISVVSGKGLGGSECAEINAGNSGISTAQCVVNNYVANNLVTFGTPTLTVTASHSGTGCSITPLPVGSNSCKLTVNVTYAFDGIGFLDLVFPTIAATTVMYY